MEAINNFKAPNTAISHEPVSKLLSGYSYLEPRDVAYAKVTPCFENGKGIIGTDLQDPSFATTELTVLRPKPGISQRYLAYLLQSPLFKNQAQSSMTGAGGLKRVSEQFVKDIKLPVPSFREQEKIADQLDHELAEIEASIADQNQLLNLLHEHLKASISHHVQPAELAEQAGVSEITIDGISWRRTTVGRVTTINGGQVDPRVEPYASMILIAPNHIETGTGRILSSETAKEQGADSGKYVARRGQLLFSKIRPTLLKSTIAPENCLCSADMYAISADENWLTNKFLMYYFLSKNFQDTADINSERVAMPKLNKETLASTTLWIPNFTKQNSVEEILKKEISNTLESVSLLKKSIHLNKEKYNIIIKENLKQGGSR